ncbi:MAG TPA: O-antigen ligase family protein [Solirubrobacteraceae bacterium]|nr:O-antigen ligase family protein [Solirubrobacteraceae bacterium]
MTPLAVLHGPLPKVGVLVLAVLAAGALLLPGLRAHAASVLAALVLAPVLLLGEIWHSPQLSMVHRHPALAAAAGLMVAALVAGLAWAMLRRRWLVAPLVVATLPFRIPIQAGGKTSNLLVPLYVVVGAGALAFVLEAFRAPDRERPRPPAAVVWLERLLALSVVLYAAQSPYSPDFETALQQMVFFYVPFTLMFCLLRQVQWTPRLLRGCLELLVGLALLFAAIGFVEYATKTIILNSKLVVENDLHTYFTVNSVFFDPNIFGRFLALVMVALAAVLLYTRRPSRQLALTAALAVLWAGLVLTLSRSSLGALLAGLGTLAALRWRVARTIAIGVAVVAIAAVVLLSLRTTFGLNQGLNGASSGRASLTSGGIHMFAQRPVWGWGSGSFVTQYRLEHPGTANTIAASHTIAVTIAAEQGAIGELTYIALVLTAAFVLLRGARGDPSRAAIGAAFVALILHSNLYADFLEDPVTWTLLGIGAALAGERLLEAPVRRRSGLAAEAAGEPQQQLV